MTNMPKAADKSAEEKAVKAADLKSEEVKAAAEEKAPAAEKKAPEKKKASAKKAAPKAAKKAVEKLVEKVEKTAKKPAARKAGPKANIVVEYQGRQIMQADLLERAKQVWANAGKTDAIKEMNLYVKPEDGAVYCVINGEAVGKFSF